jgi:lipoprotein signal peptidase
MKLQLKSLQWLLYLFILLALDLWSKYIFYDLEYWKKSYRLEPAINMGISFSIHVPYIIVIPLTIIAILGFIYLYQSQTFSKIVTLLFVAWTLGNLYDRIMYVWVRDFIVMPWRFIYNFADVFLISGMAFALLHLYYTHKKNNDKF